MIPEAMNNRLAISSLSIRFFAGKVRRFLAILPPKYTPFCVCIEK
jgi:hypothetical protein